MKNSLIFSVLSKTDKIYLQFLKYTIVGGISFLVDFFVFFFLIKLPFFIHFYTIAGTIAFLCGITTNYILSINWVFAKRKLKNKLNEFIVFLIVGIIGLILNLLFLIFFAEVLFGKLIVIDKNMNLISSKLISTFLVFLWNFFMRKFLLF